MKSLILGLLACLAVAGVDAARPQVNKEENDSAYWRKLADKDIKKALSMDSTMRRARNVILFIGDGMGPTTVTAGRILEGQLKGKTGEEHRLSFDKFPFTGLSVTYSVDSQVTDSASSATAFVSGVKTKKKLLGVGPEASLNNCTSIKGNEVESVLDWFLQDGKAAGMVTTTPVTHATPGALYAHSPNRNWEVDRFMPQEALDQGCKDIALQLVEDNPDINVILGGGERHFRPTSYNHPRPDNIHWLSNRTKGRKDEQDLIQVWQDKKKAENKKHKFVNSRDQLNSVDIKNTDYLFGLFGEFDLSFDIDRDTQHEPSIAEMTEKAIRVLQNNPNGFFLLVEGGRIDHGHHYNQPAKALHDTVAFAKAVETAVRLTSDTDTQIVVTADHSHTMSIAGYASRGWDILEKSDSVGRTLDGMPYTTLVYGNGPGYQNSRANLTDTDTTDKNYVSQATVPMVFDTHGGEDVAVYARGPQSHLHTGVHENSYIPMVMAYAACVGPYKNEDDCAPVMVDSGVNLHIHYSLTIALAISITMKLYCLL